METSLRERPKSVYSLALLCALLLAYLSMNARAERLPIKTYTTDDGLIRNWVRQTFQDSRGYLWIVTPSGLSRFDGYGFTNYGVAQNLLFPNLNLMIEDRRGYYWLATVGGLYKFTPKLVTQDQSTRFDAYALGDNPPMTTIRTVYQDRAGKVWAGGDGGLFCLDEGNGETVFRAIALPVQPSQSLRVSSIKEDPQNNLWLATNRGVFRRLPDGRIIRYYSNRQPTQAATRILFDSFGRLWIAYDEELIVCVPAPAAEITAEVIFHTLSPQALSNRASRITLPMKPGEAQCLRIAASSSEQDINDIYQTADQRLWIATRQGLFEVTDDKVNLYTVENGLCMNIVTSLGEDANSNLWIGTQGRGLMKLTRNGFITFTKADGLDEEPTIFMFMDANGVFYTTGDMSRIARFDGKRFHTFQSNFLQNLVGFGRAFNHPILRDRRGEWWIATEQGLARYASAESLEQLERVKPKAVYTTKDGMPGNRVYRIYEDRRGDLWFSVLNPTTAYLVRWEAATNRFHHFTPADGLAQEVSAYCEDKAGNLWMGFLTTGLQGGIARYRDGRFTFFTTAQGVPPGTVRNLYSDRQGRLWIGTSLGGLCRVDEPNAETPRFTTYTVADGLTDNEVNAITEDQWGLIYLGTGRGLDRFDPATGNFKHFTMADGLPTSNLNKIVRDPQMNFFIGSSSGLTYFAPQSAMPATSPAIYITRLIIAGKEQGISELGESEIGGLELENEQNNLQIEFVSPSFGIARTIRYDYKLEGADADWLPVNQRTIRLFSLPAGNYRFLVRAVNEDGAVSREPASLRFRVLRPFWLRWWFIMAALAIVAIPIALIIRYRYQHRRTAAALRRSREERLAELEQVRRRIATDLHDDVGSTLTQVSLLTEVARQSMNGASSFANDQLAIVASLSRELVDSMSDIVWAVNPQKDTLDDLTHRMRRFASDVLTAQQIEFHFHAPEEDQQIKIGANLRRELYLIFKESIHNLVRHAKCTAADVELRIADDNLWLKISDNGQGFDVEQESNGNGLVSMRERAQAFGGAFEIVSQQGEGTTISVTLPLKPQPEVADF